MSRVRRSLAGVLSLVVLSACPPPAPPAIAMPADDLGDTTVGVAYSHTVTATGGSGALSYAASGLPAGLSMNGSGTISGTATAAGDFSVTVTATDSASHTASQAYPLKVFPAPAITTATLPDGTAGQSYGAAISTMGGKAPLALSVSAGTLPNAVTLNASTGALTGALTGPSSGSPPAASTFTIQARDANGAVATQSYTVTVYPGFSLQAVLSNPGNVGTPFSGYVSAAGGGKPPIAYSVTGGALPPGVSLSASAGTITGTPTFAGTYPVTFMATDANGATGPLSLTVTILSNAPPVVVTTSLPNGVVGTAYSATLVAQQGQPPYAWSLATGSNLPPGLSLAGNGQISGTPTATGPTDFGVVATDANGQKATANLRISVFTALAVLTSSLPEGYATVAYPSTTLTASGGQAPYGWSVSGGLPAGLTFTTGSATLSGTPAAGSAGSYGVTFTVTDGSGQTQSASFTITLYALPQVATSTLADGSVGAAYSQLLQASGGKSPLSWAITTGTLPAGLALDSASGAILGTPTAAGTSNFVVQVTDVNGRTATRLLSIAVFSGLTITNGPAADGYTGTPYNMTLTAAGGRTPYNWTIISGALPPGLTLNGSNGVLSGTPTAPGTFSFTVQVTDANSVTATKALTIVIYDPPRVVTTSLPDGYTDQSYGVTLTGAAGKAPYAWSIVGGALPAGISLATSTGALGGQPTAAGNSTFTVQISDANGVTGTRPLSISSFTPPAQTSPAALPDGYLTNAYNVTLGVSGGKSPITWTSGAGLPPGITLSSAGVLSGTPTATGTFTASTTATDANGRTAVLSHSIAVFVPPTITTPSPLPDGYRSVAYSATLAATGGTGALTWSITSGALPSGLALSAGGVISGTPTASGTFTFTITVTDQNNGSASKVFTLAIQPPLVVTTTSLADGYTGRQYADTLAATGGRTPYTWAVSSGAPPPGISLSSTGVLSGTTPVTGTSGFVATVTDANGTTASQPLTVTVYAPPAIIAPTFQDAYVGTAYSATVNGSGGKAPYTWSVTAGALPAGLTLGAGSGTISGTPTGTTQSFTLTLTDANGVTASQAFTIAVYSQPAITSTSPLADGYATQGYSFTFAANGGKAPLTWTVSSGALPTGLTLSPSGFLGSTIGAAGQGQVFSFTVSVMDANARTATAPFQVTTYLPPAITTTSLTTATEGVTYLRAPATPEQLAATGGKAPLTFSATGLPAGISLAAGTGVFSGIPAQGTAGPHGLTCSVADANGRAVSVPLNLQVKAAAPVYGGGTVGVAPAGSPITDTLTVFATDYEGRTYPGLGVRLRKNGVEFAPVKEQLTDASGKAVFTGLGLNGTTDTVDVTVNGPNVGNESFLKVNAAIVSVAMLDYPVPMPRAYANGEMDPATGRLIVTGGQNPAWYGAPAVSSLFNVSQNDLLRLTSSTAGTWSEDLPPGLISSPPPRYNAGMGYAQGSHVLFGGQSTADGSFLSDTWLYSTATGAWTQPAIGGTVPSARGQAAVAGVGNLVYLFSGGIGGAPMNDFYSFNPANSTWTLIPPAGPMPQARVDAAAVASGPQLWICGGNNGFTDLSDCNSYDPTVSFWTPRGNLPSPRRGHAMASAGGSIYVFGGTVSGIPQNDLLVFNGGAWTPVAAVNPPPAREGAILAYESSTGRLILFGGEAGDTFAFNDLWTFDPPTATWTQRTQTFNKAAVGYTLTGTITNGNTGTRSRITIEASGTSGYTNRQIFNLTGGTSTYTMASIPPGDSISLTALNEDLNQPFPNREWSWLDLGVISTNVSGNLTQNVNLPTGPMTPQLLSTTGSYALPSGWLGTTFAGALARLTRPGYANHPNGFYQVTAATKTFRSDYFPLSAGATETVIPELESDTANNCELSIAWTYNVAPGPLPLVTMPPGPRSMTPGISGCAMTGTGLRSTQSLQDLPVTTAPAVAVGDMNGDGIADVTMLNGSEVAIFYGQGSGEGTFFGPSPLSLAGFSPTSMGIADFDKNGRLDVVVGLGTTNQIALFLQTGPGVFSGPFNSAAGTQVQALATGDFNGDGNPDVVVAGTLPTQISELTGTGTGSFNAPTPIIIGGSTFTAIIAADLNGDAFTDAVYAQNSGPVAFLRGTASTLQSAGAITVPGIPVSLAAGDYSGDGVQDVVAALQTPNTVQLLLNQGNFSFAANGSAPISGSGGRVAIAELTGDANKDVVVATQGNSLTLFRNLGGGALSPFSFNATQLQPGSIAVGDYNADGNLDVAVGEASGGGAPAQAELFAALRPIPTGTDAYSFAAPANTQVFALQRGPSHMAWDSELYSRGQAGNNNASFPLLSTLKPGRPVPNGQTVEWSTILYIGPPANVSMDNFSNFRVKLDAQTSPAFPSQFRR